ncbi:NUDIX hydrolase [Pigmentibacter sp. JX0631]|uniref:NUDIX hydrolase n=1 Tax=Pigmentibacter sp. JX0631 TaxID=2976982 RepID=UPI002469A285|nr:NUDIX hydrolase [Pigmentibacter sp. JX0631]WGL61041.1 NUDIX hydrolase [Pigmentibacter sp. JX0631]
MKIQKKFVSILLLMVTSCSNSSEKSDKNPQNQEVITYNGTDDLYEVESSTSPFARPKNAKIGFDVDGVLHTEVKYTANDFYYFKRPAFETTGRNIRLKKEIDFLLSNGNNPSVVTHNKSVCVSANTIKRDNLFKENGLPSIPSSQVFCVNGDKSVEINNQALTLFYDDSPGVLSLVSANSPTTKLFMPLPKHQKVAHYFSDKVIPTKPISKCGVLIVDDSKPDKRFLLQLRSPKLGEWWNFPGGSCAYHENKHLNFATQEFEDPITGAIREFDEEAGKFKSLKNELDQSKRLMVLQSNDYVLFVVKLDKNYLDNRKFVPQDKFAHEVSNKLFNIPNSPGYRWFKLSECKKGAKVDGYNLGITGKTCDTFRTYLDAF